MASEIGHRSFAPPKASLRLKTWRVCNAVMAVFTGICAVLQHNDPDPELWMVGKFSIFKMFFSLLQMFILSNVFKNLSHLCWL